MNFQIKLDNLSLGGYAPLWYNETYPSVGNRNQAGAMLNCDMTNAGYITQGAGLASLTDGTQAGAVTTLIKGSLDFAEASNVCYATGGNLLYKYTATAVTNANPFPHTISHDGSELGEDVCYYQGKLYYSYNQTGAVGDIGQYDLDSTFNDDWGSTVPTGKAALSSNPHPMLAGGDDIMYIANGNGVATYNGDTDTLDTSALDLPTGTVVMDLAWNSDRLFVAANKINLTGTNKNLASVYIWDGAATSWETEIPIAGRIGALYVKNGVVFIWYQDISNAYRLGYIYGNGVVNVADYSGGLPLFYQVSEYRDFIIWDSAGSLFAYGSGSKDLPVKIFQLADSGYSTVGCVVCPFGTPIIASNQTTSYKLAKFSGYDTNSNWKSLIFDITGQIRDSKLTGIRLNFESMTTGAKVDYVLRNSQGTALFSDFISYAKDTTNTTLYMPLDINTDNFRLEFDWTNGSTSNPVKIKNAKIYGIN